MKINQINSNSDANIGKASLTSVISATNSNSTETQKEFVSSPTKKL